MKKKLIKIAHQIVELEKKFFNGGGVQDFNNQMELITSKLSLEDMLLIDEYITSHNLLDENQHILTK